MSDDIAVFLFLGAWFIGAAVTVAVFVKLVMFFVGVI